MAAVGEHWWRCDAEMPPQIRSVDMNEMADLKSCDDPIVFDGADDVVFVWKPPVRHDAPNEPKLSERRAEHPRRRHARRLSNGEGSRWFAPAQC